MILTQRKQQGGGDKMRWAKWNAFCIFGMKHWSQGKKDPFTWTSNKEQFFHYLFSVKTDGTQELGWEKIKLPYTEKVSEELCRF